MCRLGASSHRYNEGGPQALGDRRHGNPGAEAILSRDLQQQLREELQAPPADQGLMNIRADESAVCAIHRHLLFEVDVKNRLSIDLTVT